MRIAAASWLVLLVLPLAAHAYEDCDDNNNYLESMLPDTEAIVSVSLPQKCVEASHRSLALTGYYGFCPTAAGMPARTQPRPCVSRKYVTTIHNALIDVADCLGYDPRLAFAAFNLESAMHMNAVGAALDVGIGQLTKTAIDEITQNALDNAVKSAQASTNPACARILPYMTAASSAKEQRCGFMALPENPVRNLVYSILLIQSNRRSVERYWTKLNIQLPASIDAERIKDRLTFLAYNSGAMGPVATLRAYIDQMGPERLSERLLHFESSEFYSFVHYMANYYPVGAGRESTRKRISKYVKYVIQAARRVEALARVPCFDPATFPALDTSQVIVFSGGPPSFAGAGKLIAANMARLMADEDSSSLRFQLDLFGKGATGTPSGGY